MTNPEAHQTSPPRGSGASRYSTGGGGTVLEHRYGALLLSHLLSGDPAPEMGSDVTVDRVAFQARAESDIDDYMLVGRGGDGAERRTFVAVRRAPKLIPSDVRSVELVATYLPTLLNDWLAVQAGSTRLVLASTRTTAVHELGQLATIAQTRPDESAFREAVAQPGQANRQVRKRLELLDKLVEGSAERVDSGAIPSSELTWRLLSSLMVREVRLEPPDESEHAAVTARLRTQTVGGTPAEATRLSAALGALVGRYAPTGATVDEAILRRDLVGAADLRRSSSHPSAWAVLDGLAVRLTERTRKLLVDSSGQELELERSEARAGLTAALEAAGSEAINMSSALVITGEPDVGKSALVLRAADDLRAAGGATVEISLRDLPRTTLGVEHFLGAPIGDVLAGADVRPVRVLVIDGAEAALEGRHDMLRDLASAALRVGLGVAVVTRTDAEQQVTEILKQAAETPTAGGHGPTRFVVSGLTRPEIAKLTGTFSALSRIGNDPRNVWLLSRPGLVDVLLQADPTSEIPDRALSEADVFAATWSRRVRRRELSADDGISPDEREQALLALARRALGLGAPINGSAARALVSLRSDGLLLPSGPIAAWNSGDEFASDLIRDFALARLLRVEGYKPLLSTDDPPRWAMRGARLACQSALAAADNNSEEARRTEQTQFDQLAGMAGARWSEIPLQAVLTVPDALERAWPTLSSDPEQGLSTLIRVALQRYTGFGIGDSEVLAPLVELIHDHRKEPRAHYDPALNERIVELRLAWLSGLVVPDAESDPLRARVRDTLLEQPVFRTESRIEALALLGPDLDENAEEYLRAVADEYPNALAPVIESPIAVTSLTLNHPELLAELAEAYYIIDLVKDDDPWGATYSAGDDGVRHHSRIARTAGSSMAAWYYGPFWQLLVRSPLVGLRTINRILDHGARARGRLLSDLSGRMPDLKDDNVSGLEIELPGVGRRLHVDAPDVWRWYRGTSVGPYPCVSALLAVERFADQLIALGFTLTRVVGLLLADCHNLAMPGLVAGMLIRHIDAVTDELDPWLSQPDLWSWEFERVVLEAHSPIQGADPEDLHARERRYWSLREAAAYLVLNAMARTDVARSSALRECGQALMRRARLGVPDIDPDDSSRDLELASLVVVAGWAATFDPHNYASRSLQDGSVVVEQQTPSHIGDALRELSAGSARDLESSHLITRYALAVDRNTSSETMHDDIAAARNLLDADPPGTALDPRSGPAAVAASAVLGHASGTVTLSEDDLRWAADLLIGCAISPHAGEFAYEETVNRMEADRSAAAAAPALLLLCARGEIGSPSREQVEDALLASATSRFHEVRLIAATALIHVWESGCVLGIEGASCIHETALQATEAAARLCHLGPRGGDGHRLALPITGSLLAELAKVAPEDVLPAYLVAPIAAAADAATLDSCVREQATHLCDELLQAHIRGVMHWLAQGWDYSDPLDHNTHVANALFSLATRGEPDYLLRHIEGYVHYPAALSPDPPKKSA